MSNPSPWQALIAGLSLLSLSACGAPPPPQVETTPSPQVAATPSPPPPAPSQQTHSHGGKGGQIIETGRYHLELMVGREEGGLHIDFYIQEGEDHIPVGTATVTADIETPTGDRVTLPMTYTPEDEHYTARLANPVAGDYRIVLLSTINGEPINSRFRFRYEPDEGGTQE